MKKPICNVLRVDSSHLREYKRGVRILKGVTDVAIIARRGKRQGLKMSNEVSKASKARDEVYGIDGFVGLEVLHYNDEGLLTGYSTATNVRAYEGDSECPENYTGVFCDDVECVWCDQNRRDNIAEIMEQGIDDFDAEELKDALDEQNNNFGDEFIFKQQTFIVYSIVIEESIKDLLESLSWVNWVDVIKCCGLDCFDEEHPTAPTLITEETNMEEHWGCYPNTRQAQLSILQVVVSYYGAHELDHCPRHWTGEELIEEYPNLADQL